MLECLSLHHIAEGIRLLNLFIPVENNAVVLSIMQLSNVDVSIQYSFFFDVWEVREVQ